MRMFSHQHWHYCYKIFETQLGRFTKDASSRDDAIFSLEEVSELETIFKSRAVNAIDSGIALEQHQGLGFLWMLGQIDAELVAQKRNHLFQMMFRSRK